ncbi:hypothetical protein [Glycomyces buryatensis]|uniref:Uncharacterized protein n=1 Tax=Glycomyces buryatensis TaxID=2570927 RepID=A0A4S8PRQ8_9ACTN|nr:hypothetical protein [Glycomyces buryatensis]THV33918.1 hypothetical protein FAB82_24385 [Glycomyces buryatensis]
MTDPMADLVPDRMDLIAEWTTASHEKLELYTDLGTGDARLLLITDRTPAEHVATFFHACGVTIATVWKGTASANTPGRTNPWRETQRTRAAAYIAATHADNPTANPTGSDIPGRH